MLNRSESIPDNEEGIKEVKKEGFRSTTVHLPTLFISPDMSGCLPLKALLFFISLILLLCVRATVRFCILFITAHQSRNSTPQCKHPKQDIKPILGHY